MILTRRRWLRLASAFGAVRLLGKPSSGFLHEPLFIEVPASASGIDWVHENAMSPSHYLPEALGPGCAFLDFDNDGWMDIYLVNSGPCDFWKPAKPSRNALYKNNRDGTFTDVTEKAGVVGRQRSEWAWRSGTTTTTAGRTSSSPLMANAFSIITIMMEPSPM